MREHFVALALVVANAERAAEMIQHDFLGRAGPQQIREIAELRVIQPRFERHVVLGQPADTALEGGVAIQTLGRAGGRGGGDAGVEGAGMADALEPPAAGRGMGFQGFVDRVPQQAIGLTDDPRAGAKGAVFAGLALRRHGGHEFGFAYRLQRLRPVLAIGGAALNEHRRFHVVPGGHVGHEVFQQIPVRPRFPKMMMRIDDRLLGIENLLPQHRQPIGPHARMVKRKAFGHGISPVRSFAPDTAMGLRGVQRRGLRRLGRDGVQQ